MSAEIIFGYVPVPDPETGARLVKKAMSEKLAACGNLLGPVISFYEWEGEAMEEKEWVLLLKTTPKLQDALGKLIESIHPYTCPCVSFFPVQANSEFSRWVESQTA